MKEDIYALVGARVREERKKAGLTIERLAELAGISPSFLAYIENKGRKASLETVQKLARALRLPVVRLFKGAAPAEKDAVYSASQQFIQMIQDKKESEVEAILGVVRAVSKTIGKKKG